MAARAGQLSNWCSGPAHQVSCRRQSAHSCMHARFHCSWCCCREAKLSVLAWDPEAAELAPSGLHYFEGDPALRAGRTVFPMPPLAVTDPQVAGRGSVVGDGSVPAVSAPLLALPARACPRFLAWAWRQVEGPQYRAPLFVLAHAAAVLRGAFTKEACCSLHAAAAPPCCRPAGPLRRCAHVPTPAGGTASGTGG